MHLMKKTGQRHTTIMMFHSASKYGSQIDFRGFRKKEIGRTIDTYRKHQYFGQEILNLSIQ